MNIDSAQEATTQKHLGPLLKIVQESLIYIYQDSNTVINALKGCVEKIMAQLVF